MPLPTWPPHEAHQAVDAARAAGAAKDAGASDSFSYGMAAPAPAVLHSRPAPAADIAKMLGVQETFSQREKEGPAPQAWEDEGLQRSRA